jgi:hypothetical protein
MKLSGKKYLAMFLLISLMYSCHNQIDQNLQMQVKKMLGKEIKLNGQTETTHSTVAKIKLVTRINGNCMPCIQKLNLWNPFIKKLEKDYGVTILFYVAVSDTSFLRSTLNEIHFLHPIIIDYNDDFLKENHLPANSIFHTLLLDSANKVCLVGSPINNKTLQQLYIKRIEELQNK